MESDAGRDGAGHQRGIESQGGRRQVRGITGVAPRQPEQHLKQLPQQRQRLVRGHLPGLVHRVVALAANQVHLLAVPQAGSQMSSLAVGAVI
ncbi:MAG: hypothetical protein ACRDPW_03685 [Mycobacteriales bacterium]